MNYDRFIGIPYLDKGRSIEGLDCWGLVRLFFDEIRDIKLPSYSDSYITGTDRKEVAKLIAGELSDWQSIEPGKEEKFDAVLMREGKFPRHTGVVISPGMVLHVQQGQTSCIERYRFGPLANRVVGFFRYQNRE